MTQPLRLVVLGDSFAFTDDRGPQLPDEPALFPNVIAARLGSDLGRPVRTATVARAGWGVREVWEALTKDRHLQFELLAGADAVVLAIGSYDHLPAGLPPVLEEAAAYLRPAWLRRRYRRGLRTVGRRLIRLTRGRFRRVPAEEFARLYDLVLGQVRGLTRGAAVVALGPAGQAAAQYGRMNPHLSAGGALQERIAGRHGIAFVPVRSLVEPHRACLNPDGIHWPPEVHRAVGRAAAGAIAAQITGSRPTPPDPWQELASGSGGSRPA